MPKEVGRHAQLSIWLLYNIIRQKGILLIDYDKAQRISRSNWVGGGSKVTTWFFLEALLNYF